MRVTSDQSYEFILFNFRKLQSKRWDAGMLD